MKAIIITSKAEPIQLVEVPEPVGRKGECLVRIKHTSLNHRDQWIREGKYPDIKKGTVLESDGYGIVEKGSEQWVGKEIVLNPNMNWGKDPNTQSADYSVLGMPTNGTLTEYISVSEDRLIETPAHLSQEESAALPVAGLTAYRAVFTKGQVSKDQKVLITGIGGGVSQFGLQFAITLGANVFVTSGSDEKIKRACMYGAKAGFNYTKENWVQEANQVDGFDVIIDSAGGNLLNSYIKLIKSGGRIVVYGSTTGYPQKLDIFRLFWSQAQIMGSTMGNDKEFIEMVKFVADNQLKPTIDKIYSFENYLAAFDRFSSPDRFGKIILTIDQSTQE